MSRFRDWYTRDDAMPARYRLARLIGNLGLSATAAYLVWKLIRG